jgi:hypothetical protein
MNLDGVITGIRIESAITPTITIDRPFQDSGTVNPLLALIKPKVTLITPFGESVSHPWGDPGASMWPTIQVGVVLLIAAAVVWKFAR